MVYLELFQVQDIHVDATNSMEEDQGSVDVDSLNIAQQMSPFVHIQCFHTMGQLVLQVEKNNLDFYQIVWNWTNFL